MKRLLLLIISITCIAALFNSIDNRPSKWASDTKENGNNFQDNKTPINYQYSSVLDTHGAIPGLTGFYDYVTNGNNVHKLWYLGDTILASVDQTDSASAQTSNARRSYYQESTDGGATWLSDPILVSTNGNAYPDIVPIIISGQRSISISGRNFVGTTRRGYVGTDVVLGAGSFTISLNAGAGSDNFSAGINANTLACGWINLTGDSVFYAKYDCNANSYNGVTLLSGDPSQVATNVRQYTAANNNQNVAVAWWYPTAPTKLYYRQSTNNGTSFGAAGTIITEGLNVNGDIVGPWFGADLIYKPGTTNLMMAFNTLETGNLGTAQGSKLMFWAPGINGGNPLVIVDYHNAPSNAMVSDTSYYNNHYSPSFHQVGLTALSHPSLAYSSNGSRLFCVYSVVQKDTSSYSFFFNDICESYSDDNGATWSSPVIITNTTNTDEIYPTISRTQNSTTSIVITYSLSECPGSTSFTNTTTPICKVWQVIRRYNAVTGAEEPLIIGIKNISNEVPANYSLSQNYPNPFNPSTKIRFAVPKSTNVSIKVFDVVGRLVAVLADNEYVKAGTKEVEFDASQLSSGVYFYKLITADFTATRKMILVK